MNWFILALAATLGWGNADLFYKMGNDDSDKDSHLKTAVWVGLVMGISAAVMLIFSGNAPAFPELLLNAVKYAPASVCYIISMVIGYAGLRYLELSICSPIQNASGAFSTVAMFIFFMITGRISGIKDAFSTLDICGSIIIVIGVICLAIVENRLSAKESEGGHKYRFGAKALLFPLLYCIFDTIGTAADGIILDEETGLGLGEIDVLILYGFTFMFAGLIAWIFMLIKNKKAYNPFAVKELKTKAPASLFEEIGQIFYVFAMAAKPMLAAPMIASYCIVSVCLSRLFLKEKLKAGQYACVFTVIAGIVILGISEGLA